MSPDHARPNSGVPGDLIPIARLLPRAGLLRHGRWWRPRSRSVGALRALEPGRTWSPMRSSGTSAILTGAIMAGTLPPVSIGSRTYSQIGMSHLVGESGSRAGWVRWGSPARFRTRPRSGRQVHSAHRADRDLEVEFAAVATDLATGRPHVFGQRPLIPVLLASSAIPGSRPGDDPRPALHRRSGLGEPACRAGGGARSRQHRRALDTGTREVGEVETSAASARPRRGDHGDEPTTAAAARCRCEVPVLLLPTPPTLGGTLEFGNTMRRRRRLFHDPGVP